ncbi:hypothetical protein O7632_12740 [Solwaraspora sp. WMMD406]|uniref:hypothetical protein n=1 Tax=Solwaraspora sp. WMMD406 TaxID=3016095 RepID=UPI002418038A|nr:hypothetical protein [Solwaraspora sp. WMMD406]MDG4764958.1 hypothetical protein [Solwaraspora sp. WMMD406]
MPPPTAAPSLPTAPPDPGDNPSPGLVASPPQPEVAPAARATPASPLGMVRYLLIAALLVGLVGGIAGPILRRLATRPPAGTAGP